MTFRWFVSDGLYLVCVCTVLGREVFANRVVIHRGLNYLNGGRGRGMERNGKERKGKERKEKEIDVMIHNELGGIGETFTQKEVPVKNCASYSRDTDWLATSNECTCAGLANPIRSTKAFHSY